jgi:hypothetical protein
MATSKAGAGRKAFLAKIRNQKTPAAPPKKSVNEKLERMLESMMEDATSESSDLTFSEKMALGGLVLKLEAVRNKISDEDYGTGFLNDDTSTEPDAGLDAGIDSDLDGAAIQ